MARRHSFLKGFYEIEKTIGCGGFAKVKLATHLATGEKVAVKIMDKILLGKDLPRISLELNALKTLSHEHICKLYQVIETETHFYLVMEYCSGGELFDHIVEKNRLSESESRMFFRQIVSAVAYLHSLGYAHRDLKPENVLLDKYQNLKLIDFGLCAKPKGGMESPLFTSCGSPTYAAPELVTGKQYLGPEVDVWAMGVLLYALLSGCLPFDDVNIDSLYKKILAGKYHEPSFMSAGSLKLIKSMLQVDPKKRITVEELLSHSWLTLGILDTIKIKSEDLKHYDADCVKVIANYYQVEPVMMWKIIKKWNYDYLTATYYLLLTRKKRKLPLRLNSSVNRVDIFDAGYQANMVKMPSENEKKDEDEENMKKPECNKVRNTSENTPQNNRQNRSRQNKDFVEPNRPSSIRKPLKRIRSPGPEDCSPVPSKRSNLEYSTPERKPNSDNSDTPGSARRVLGSIERSFHKVVHVLTPRKAEDSSNMKPALLTNKEMCNVSTTQCHNPDVVIEELTRALEKKGIQCKRKGYTLRGKFHPSSGQSRGECSFELEICYLPNIEHMKKNGLDFQTPTKSILKKGSQSNATPKNNDKVQNGTDTGNIEKTFTNPYIIGIRRKRLKGDSWFYKKVCEEVLSLTATCFKGLIESAV